jgi:hypothetical protein|tara:strand:+ start:570 stop:833 length:264 start_codon:yes stop_codon:yes gene_type:complete
MIKNDDRQIWSRLTERTLDPYDAEGEEPGPAAELDPGIGFNEDNEGCPNLENLIRSSKKDEDAEGKETINVNDEADSFDEIDEHTPL